MVARLASRIARVARKPERWLLPRRLVLIVTTQRSGSTWLFDALRAHPCLEMVRLASVFEVLGLRGRRYPRDLSNAPEATRWVEVSALRWQRVVDFTARVGSDLTLPRPSMPQTAVEKLHPEFFDCDVPRFLARVAAVERRAEVRFIYQVRDPSSSLGSFLKYKERAPTWYAHVPPEAAAAHFRRDFEAIRRLLVERPGLVLDYRNMMPSSERVLDRALRFVWPAAPPPDPALVSAMAAVTSRDARARNKTAFLGAAAGPVSGASGIPPALLDASASELRRSEAAYSEILGLGQNREAILA